MKTDPKPRADKRLKPDRSTWAGAWIKRGAGRSNGSIVGEGEARAWLDALRTRGASAKTLGVYGNALASLRDALAQRGRAALVDVNADDLAAWRLSLVNRGCAPGTLETYLRAARHWLRWLTERGTLFENPAAALEIPYAARKLLPVPSVADLRRLLAVPNVARPCGLRDRALLETAYACGARREELHALDVHDVNLDHGSVRVVGKGRRERVLPLTRAAVTWLRRYTETARPKLLKGKLDEPALWIDLHGARLSYASLHALVKKHAKAAGLAQNVTPHTLRRACATHLLQNGAHAVQLQMLLGHATLKHLSQYLRLSIAELQAMHRRSKPGA